MSTQAWQHGWPECPRTGDLTIGELVRVACCGRGAGLGRYSATSGPWVESGGPRRSMSLVQTRARRPTTPPGVRAPVGRWVITAQSNDSVVLPGASRWPESQIAVEIAAHSRERQDTGRHDLERLSVSCGESGRGGAPGGTRTHDLQVRNLTLYPLSYGRTRCRQDVWRRGGDSNPRSRLPHSAV